VSNKPYRFILGTVEALETRRGRWVFWLLAAASFLAIGANAVYRAEAPEKKFVATLDYSSPTEIAESRDAQAQWRSSEFRGFRSIAWGVVMEGKDPYADCGHVRAYPPFFGIAFFPFAVPWEFSGLGSALFCLVSIAFALLAASCLSRWADGKGRFGLFALTYILLAPLALDVIVRCESDMLILFPVALGFLWIVQGRRKFSAGMLLGFAASLKVLPGLFGLYLICSRRWSALAGMIAGGIVCTVVLPVVVFGPHRALDLHVSWLQHVVGPYHSGGAGTFIRNPYRGSNQSLTAAINRYTRPVFDTSDMDSIADFNEKANRNINPVSLPCGLVSPVVKVLQLLVLLGLIVTWAACSRGAPQPKTTAMLMAAVAPGILLLSEISLTTHHVLLILPLSALLVRMLVLEDLKAAQFAWALFLYVAAVLVVGLPLIKPCTPLLLPTLAALWFCAALAWKDRSAGPEKPAVKVASNP
jgi:hypothetical protein